MITLPVLRPASYAPGRLAAGNSDYPFRHNPAR